MAFISSAAMKAAVAALLVFAAVSPAARAVAAEAEAKAKAVGGAPSVPAGSLDIAQLGAKGDGKSDSTPMVLKAWKHACEATGQQKIVIPKGNYLTGALDLVGPCKSSIIIRLDGNLLGTGDLNAYKRNWIEIQNVDNLSINGHGTIDGQGALVWNKNECQRSYNCKILPNSLVLDFVTNAQIRGITLLNSKFFHMNIFGSKNVVIDKVTIKAPGNSPNTDGIHIGDSSNVTISGTTIAVGDDCVSIGPGSKTIRVKGVKCGPGHGISVGSLGRYKDEKDVEDVKVTGCTLAGTTNGLRIKSWPSTTSSSRTSTAPPTRRRPSRSTAPTTCPARACSSSTSTSSTTGPTTRPCPSARTPSASPLAWRRSSPASEPTCIHHSLFVTSLFLTLASLFLGLWQSANFLIHSTSVDL
ncbi:hypothetical protein ZEAMMB73_Zm00001d053662 [Zea mays]|uniref:Pectin lyase-like superfamily protein n=1 Tax=Zea mays TaxID=4577 RepID=A0A1D6QRB5_MAIZE|nr:hypothetical protein ZEAMMB73_Zm00001d053662 [Zea mays]